MVAEEEGVGRTQSRKRRKLLIICLCAVLALFFVAAVCLVIYFHNPIVSPTLKETVIDRCTKYLQENNDSSGNNCDLIWTAFERAFVGRNPCDVPREAYDHLINTVTERFTCNRMLFWSKTKDVAHAFTEKNSCFLTLEDTLLGSSMDGLTWCGQVNSSDVHTTGCPSWRECVNNPVSSFWKRASAAFAESACGNVTAMLNGSIATPFSSSSIFGSIELKNFNPSLVNSLSVVLVTKEDDNKTCHSDASLLELQKELDTKLKYYCKEVSQSKVQECTSQSEEVCRYCW